MATDDPPDARGRTPTGQTVRGLPSQYSLSEEKAGRLREKLESYIGRPESHELPKDSEAITGAYSAEEAERWIIEYEKFMSESEYTGDEC